MMGFGFMGIGALLFVGFWVLVIAGGVWLVMTLTRSAQGQTTASHPPLLTSTSTQALTSAPTQTPLDVLKMRYAKGEITAEQFNQMKQDLSA
ncbi:MAG: SHOCT domain-containing protein [Chloroflexi bacterium]|nr:SHOCT domain-containing protein [Chloroflexota bacterium]